jgi:murein L,D-transpeptidase YafK
MTKRSCIAAATAAIVFLLAACSVEQELAPHMRPLSKDAMMLLGKKGMTTESPIFVRIFKEESELEIWKARDDGHYYHFKTYPICNWSGEVGPKLQEGDKQAPEGFYWISKGQMNPNSSFHLSFNLGYPNAYDKAHGRTGSALMVHGKCKSAGCYAMTDALIEEIYALAREQFAAGHERFPVHAFPFRMTDENMARFKGHKWHAFWQILKEGYDHFETTRKVPDVTVCERRYHVNAKPVQQVASRIDPEGRCPRLERAELTPFKPVPKDAVADARITAPGPKMRGIASMQGRDAAAGNPMSGLLKAPNGASTGLGLTRGD